MLKKKVMSMCISTDYCDGYNKAVEDAEKDPDFKLAQDFKAFFPDLNPYQLSLMISGYESKVSKMEQALKDNNLVDNGYGQYINIVPCSK